MARGRGTRILDFFSFGGRVPGGVGLVIAVTLACSLTVAFGSRHTAPLYEYAALVPAEVWRGQVWRLLTWGVIELSPISLIFTCLFYYWFGKDLANVWGSTRFLVLWVAMNLIASVGTSLIALVDRSAMELTHIGAFAISCAFSVAWGLWFPDRRFLLFFFFPVTGRIMAWGTVAVTVIYAIYAGWEHVLPHLLAEGAMLAWIFRGTLTNKIQSARQSAARKSAAAAKRKQAVSYLRVVEAHDDDELPPEIEGKIQEIVRGKRPDKPDLN